MVKRKLYRPEVKGFKDVDSGKLQPHHAEIYIGGTNDHRYAQLIAGTALPVHQTPWNEWLCLGWNSQYMSNSGSFYFSYKPADAEHSTQFQNAEQAFTNALSFFYPPILKGTAENQRIGRQISVIKDKWQFKFVIPALHKLQTDDPPLGAPRPLWYINKWASQRRYRMRLVAVWFDKVEDNGVLCHHPFEIFRYDKTTSSNYKSTIDAQFNTESYRNYKVWYDKTKEFTMLPQPESATYTVPTQQSSMQMEAYFTVKFPKHIKEWRDGVDGISDSNMLNASIPDTTLEVRDAGLSRGGYAFYIFLEDIFAIVDSNGSEPLANGRPKYKHPNGGVRLYAKHDLNWIDP